MEEHQFLRTIKKKLDAGNYSTVKMTDLQVDDVFVMFEKEEQIGGDWIVVEAPTHN